MNDLILKSVAVEIARDVLGLRRKLFNRFKEKIEKTPEIKTVHGYNITDLIVFADACNRAGITDVELRDFVQNASEAWRFALKEQERIMKEYMEEEKNKWKHQ